VYAKLLETGKEVPPDPERARDLIDKAAKGNYGPALYEVGRRQLDGTQPGAGGEKARDMVHIAVVLGSIDAQYFMGAAYEQGVDGYPQDADRARQFFRLCATAGQRECQFRLGKLLLERPARQERAYEQAVAWLDLAAAQAHLLHFAK